MKYLPALTYYFFGSISVKGMSGLVQLQPYTEAWTVADVSQRKPGSKWWVVVKDMGSCSKYSQLNGLHKAADI